MNHIIFFRDKDGHVAQRLWSGIPRVGDTVTLSGGPKYAKDGEAASFRVERVDWRGVAQKKQNPHIVIDVTYEGPGKKHGMIA